MLRSSITVVFGLTLIAAGCGEPFDRRDGSLLIVLEGAPTHLDQVQAQFRSPDGREFELALPRPDNDVISDFSALPVGLGALDIRLLAGDSVQVRLSDIPVQISEGAAQEVAPFRDVPELEVSVRTSGPHPRWAGPIFIDVQERSPAPPSDPELEVSINGQPQVVPAAGPDGWILQVDPGLAADLLPADLKVDMQVCFRGLDSACRQHTEVLTVTRRVWTQQLAGRPSGPALHLTRGWAVVGHAPRTLRVVDEQSGATVQSDLDLGAEPAGPAVQVGDVVAIATRDGVVHGFALGAQGLNPLWQVTLSSRPSPVVAGTGRFVIADQAVLLGLDPSDGSQTSLGQLSAPVSAAPLAHQGSVVAADLLGQVLAVGPEGQERFRIDLGAAVYAPVVADGSGYKVCTTAGDFIGLDSLGERNSPTVALGAPVVFAPIRLSTAWAVAAARNVAFIQDGGEVQWKPVGERILGAPTAWTQEDGVVMGLFNGRVVLVRPGAPPRTLAKLSGLALAPRVLQEPSRVLVGTSLGALQMLRVEDGF